MVSPDFIDLYCERTAAGVFDEPLNAVSNIAFILAALAAWPAAAHRSAPNPFEKIVIALAGLIGIGSFLFHTLATPLSELGDVIPIWTFVLCYIVLTIYRATAGNRARTVRLTVLILAIVMAVFWFTGRAVTTEASDGPLFLNGSLQYAPAVIALLVASLMMGLARHPARFYIMAATATFIVSLAFRSIDLVTCTATHGLGTHFLWHLLNGLMIGILLQALVRKMPPPGKDLRG